MKREKNINRVLGGIKSCESLHQAPPVNDKGALLTAPVTPKENRVLIDFCAFTVKVSDPVEALKASGFDPGLFSESSGGGMGYKKSMRYDGIVCFYDGNEDMGCHISMTGHGCRVYENLHSSIGLQCWNYLFRDVLSIGGSFSRLDIAIDNVDGRLSLARINHAVKTKSIRSRYKRSRCITDESLSRAPGQIESQTRYFGSMDSRCFIRFYNKAAEQELKHDLASGSLGRWVRCELVLRDDRASVAVDQIVSGMPIGQLVVAAVNNYLAVIKVTESNISRCPLRRWWARWLGTTEKLKLTTQKAIKTIVQVKDHIMRQYSASFAMIKKGVGVARFHDFVTELVDIGRDKMTKRHEKVLLESGVKLAVNLPF